MKWRYSTQGRSRDLLVTIAYLPPIKLLNVPTELCKVEGSSSAFGLPDEFLVGLPIIVRWSGFFRSPDLRRTNSFSPVLAPLLRARRLT
jgi:hypothetical protein